MHNREFSGTLLSTRSLLASHKSDSNWLPWSCSWKCTHGRSSSRYLQQMSLFPCFVSWLPPGRILLPDLWYLVDVFYVPCDCSSLSSHFSTAYVLSRWAPPSSGRTCAIGIGGFPTYVSNSSSAATAVTTVCDRKGYRANNFCASA